MSRISQAGRGLKALACAAVLSICLCRAEDDKPKEPIKEPAEADIFVPGPNVKAPKLLHYVEPEFSPNSKEAFVEGVVKVSTVVAVDGTVSTCEIVRGLNAEEDRTAIRAVKLWRFQPGTKEGKAVKVRVTVEIEFHLM